MVRENPVGSRTLLPLRVCCHPSFGSRMPSLVQGLPKLLCEPARRLPGPTFDYASAIAIYLCLTSLKSVSSMKLHRDKVSQPTAWFMLHRREAWAHAKSCSMVPVFWRTAGEHTGPARKVRGGGKVAVAGVKDRTSNQVRARVVGNTDSETLQGFVRDSVSGALMPRPDRVMDYDHESVKHSPSTCEGWPTPTESGWAAHKGTFHKLSPKHLDRYVRNSRDATTSAS